MTVIKYIIPEDGDDQAHPNVFVVSSLQPTLSDLKKDFPLPGEYQFRFLRSMGEMQVWIDIVDDGSVIPTFDGGIFAKISRRLNPSLQPKSSSTPTPQPLERVLTSTSSSSISPLTPHQDKRRNSERLIKFDDESEHVSASPNSSFPDSGDLLGFSSPSVSAGQAVSNNVDLFGLDSLQPISNQAPSSNTSMGMGMFPATSMPRGSSSGNLPHTGFDAFSSLDTSSAPMQGMRPVNSSGAFPQAQAGYGQFPPRGAPSIQPPQQRRPF